MLSFLLKKRICVNFSPTWEANSWILKRLKQHFWVFYLTNFLKGILLTPLGSLCLQDLQGTLPQQKICHFQSFQEYVHYFTEMLKTLKSCLHINHFLKYKNTANNYKLVNWGRVRKLGSVDTSCRMWCLALKCHRILDLISYSGDVFLSYPIQHVHVHYRSGRNWIMKKKMTDMKSCFTSLDCVTCCSNDCFFNSWKRRRIRGRACYFVGNSKLKFTLIKPIKIATNRYTTPHIYQNILTEIVHAALIGYIKVPKTETIKISKIFVWMYTQLTTP